MGNVEFSVRRSHHPILIEEVDSPDCQETARELSQSSGVGRQEPGADAGRQAPQKNDGNACKFAIIEKRPFLRECLARSLSSCSTIPVESFGSVSDILAFQRPLDASLLILSVVRLTEDEARRELITLFKNVPHLPTIVLAHEDDMNGAIEALGYGARGYIPVSLGFDIAIEAMRFVNAGGTYVPAECLLATRQSPPPAAQTFVRNTITNRELAVIQALREGKPNKIIAYELNMCESTVKVHLRHLMKKLRARNRTEVAMKAGDIVQSAACAMQTRCASGEACASASEPGRYSGGDLTD